MNHPTIDQKSDTFDKFSICFLSDLDLVQSRRDSLQQSTQEENELSS